MAVVSRPKITVSADTVTVVQKLETTVSVTSGAEGFYSADQITWIKIEGDLCLTENGVYYFKAVNPENGLESSSYTILEVNNIDNVAPTLEIKRDKFGMTNQDITLTATSGDGTVEYFNGSEWVAGNTLVVTENGTYHFRATDAVGNVTEESVVIKQIDKVAPTLEITGNATQWTNQPVTLTATVSDGTVEYFDGSGWVTGNYLTVSENGTYQFRVSDEAGNVTEKSVVVDKIDMTAELSISHILDGDKVRIFATSGEGTVEYYNGSEWVAGNTLTVTENSTLQFRVSDAAGNVTEKKVVIITESLSNVERLNSGDVLIVNPGVFITNVYTIPADCSVTIYEGAVSLSTLGAFVGAKINGFQLSQISTVSGINTQVPCSLRLTRTVVNNGETGTLYAGQRANTVQVLGGGSVVVHDHAFLANATVEAGASLVLHSGAVLETYPSVGTAICAGASVTIEDGVLFNGVTNFEAGAKINGFLLTKNTSVSPNVLLNVNTVSVAADETGTVYAGQKITNVQVANGGNLVIKNGGRAEEITMGLSSSLTIESGGRILGTQKLSGDITIHDGALFDTLEITKGFTINGFSSSQYATLTNNQLILSGVTVKANQTGTVYAGQTINSVQVAEGGSLVIKNGGTAASATFAANNSLTIESGGKLTGSVTCRGDITIHDGAQFESLNVAERSKVNGFTLSAAFTFTNNYLELSGTAVTVRAGDTGIVYAGQKVSAIRVTEGGSLVISSGAWADSVSFALNSSLTIESGGKLTGSVTCRGNITICEGALFDSLNIVYGSKVNGFTFSRDWTFTNSHLELSGTAVTVRAGDTGTVYAGQKVSGIGVAEGGSLVLRDGAIADGITVAAGASITIESGASFTKLHIYSGATINGIKVQENCTFSDSDLNALYPQREISDGKTLILGAGQTAENVDITEGGSLIIHDNAHAGQINVDRGAITVHAGAQFDSISTTSYFEINGFVWNTALSNSTVSISNVIVDATRTGTLYAGQTAEYVTITGGGHVIVHDQATANNVRLLEGGAITVHAGAQFDSITTVGMYEINGFTVFGSTNVNYQNGIISLPESVRVIVNTGDTGTLYAGQSANSVTVSCNGKMEVMDEAKATNVKVAGGGFLTVYSGGTINSSNVSGSITIHAGAQFDTITAAASSKVNGFTVRNTASFTDSVLNISQADVQAGDTGTVYSGQSASDITVAVNGNMEVMEGAQVSGVTVSGSITVYDNASFSVKAYLDAKINGFTVSSSGAIFSNDHIAGVTVNAGDTGTVYAGQTVQQASVSRGGQMVVRDGGTAYNVNLKQGGTLLLQGTLDLSDGGSISWGSSPSQVQLEVDGGKIELALSQLETLFGYRIAGITNETISVAVDSADLGEYVIVQGYTGNFDSVTITCEGNILGQISVGGGSVTKDTFGYSLVNNSGQLAIVIKDAEAPDAPVITAVSSTEMTNQDVIITLSVDEDAVSSEYSLDGMTWYSFTDTVTAAGNGTYYFRSTDAAGNISEVATYEVNNIDREAPTLEITGNAAEWTNQDITLTAVVSDGTVEYFDGSEWVTGNTLTVTENGTYQFRVTDAAGNVNMQDVVVDKIDKDAPTAPQITVSNEGNRVTVSHNGVVEEGAGLWKYEIEVSTVSDFSVLSSSYQYSGGNSFDKITLEDGNYYFRVKAIDILCNESSYSNIVNLEIDTTAPDAPEAYADTAPTNQSVSVEAVFGSGTALEEYSLDGKQWQIYTGPVIFEDNGVIYFRGTDAAGNVSEVTTYEVNNIDKDAPTLEITGNATEWTFQDVVLTAVVSDGTVEYFNGSEWIVGTVMTVSENGTYQFRVTDAAGNITEQSITVDRIDKNTVPQNLQSSAEGVTWDGTKYAENYQIKLVFGNNGGAVSFETSGTGVDFFSSAERSFSWQVSADNDEWVGGNEIVITDTAPQKYSPAENGQMDLFIAGVNGVWDNECVAQHMGMISGWTGTNEFVVLDGKNILADIFEGSADANILLMTDDANGDALFVDDIYTALPGTVTDQQARIAKIDEIRAGNGDDIVDMTSQQFAYIGNGVKVYGGHGNDTIWANNGNNSLFGDAGNDRLIGGADNDLIVGGAGNDRMHGGGGSDIFCFGENWGSDSVEQLAGSEIILWFKNGSESNWDAATLTYTDGENSVSVQGVSADKITLKFGDDGSQRYDELASAGCFDDAASGKIFEDKDKGILA